jgi:phytoene desaturase
MAKRAKSTASGSSVPAACVVGAGLGGLALAIRLQAAGLATTLIEARPSVGGLVRRLESEGFAFEEGPSVLADPAPLDELLSLGAAPPTPPDWIAVDPAARFLWSDGTAFDMAGEPTALLAQVARVAPDDIAGIEPWREWCAGIRGEGWRALAETRLEGPMAVLRAAPAAWREKAWQSAWQVACGAFGDHHLRQALASPAILSGGNPLSASALLLAGQPMAGMGPGWWPLGGMAALADRLAARFQALGGTLRLHDPVVRIHALGNRASEVETQSGWRLPVVAVACAADPLHCYRDLLRDTARGRTAASRLARRRYSPSALSVHFALAGSWPGIPHQTVLLGARFAELFADLFDHGVLPRDMMIWLHHPTVTQPDLAPPGHSLMRATIPVAHLGKLPVDWEVLGPTIAERVLDEVGRRLIPDIRDRILARRITTPRDLALDLGLHLGSGWNLEPRLSPLDLARVPQRDPKMPNLYFAGAATRPGAGVAAVLAGAKIAAERLQEDLR